MTRGVLARRAVGPALHAFRAVSRVVGLSVTWVLVVCVRGYQLTVSPLLGPVCRFYPSCSHYAVGALRAHGAVRGTGLVLWRLARCNPWNAGGVDLVPPVHEHLHPTSELPACRAAPSAPNSAHAAATHDGAPDLPVRAA